MTPQANWCVRATGFFAGAIACALIGMGTLASVGAAQGSSDQEKKEEKKDDKKKEEKKALPLKAERKIEFTADEGTWLSLDVSPNG